MTDEVPDMLALCDHPGCMAKATHRFGLGWFDGCDQHKEWAEDMAAADDASYYDAISGDED